MNDCGTGLFAAPQLWVQAIPELFIKDILTALSMHTDEGQ